MAAAHKSNEYVDDSGSESDGEIEFQPPKHFHKSKPASSVKIQNDKEIWLIKTPKGFPLKNLKTLPVSFTATSISNGPSRFNLNQKNFQVNEELLGTDTESSKYAVLTNENKKNFKIVGQDISRFYNIRESVDIPSIAMDEVVKPRKNIKEIKNLRMRHFPTGYGAEDFDEAKPQGGDVNASDTDSEDDGKIVKKAKIEEKSKSDKKDKKEKKETKEKKEKKEKKSKKEKKDKHH